jgi:hypothetical protein
MTVRRGWVFLFTPWSFLLGLGVILEHRLRLDMSRRPMTVRAAAHLGTS